LQPAGRFIAYAGSAHKVSAIDVARTIWCRAFMLKAKPAQKSILQKKFAPWLPLGHMFLANSE
jgi:hypothetical protein